MLSPRTFEIRWASATMGRGKTLETFVIPNAEAGALNTLYRLASSVESVEYGDEYITAVATVDARAKGNLAGYLK